LAQLARDRAIAKEKAESQIAISKHKKELELAKLETQKILSQNNKEVAKDKTTIDKEIALAKIQSAKSLAEDKNRLSKDEALNDKEVALAKLKMEREIALIKEKSQIEGQDKKIKFYIMIALMVVGVILFIILIIYLIHRRNKKTELKLQEDGFRHEEYIEASKQHNEHVKKMLDIITDENADKAVKKEIVRLLKEQGKQGNLVEYKR